jgi:hypothetical protein
MSNLYVLSSFHTIVRLKDSTSNTRDEEKRFQSTKVRKSSHVVSAMLLPQFQSTIVRLKGRDGADFDYFDPIPILQ